MVSTAMIGTTNTRLENLKLEFSCINLKLRGINQNFNQKEEIG